MLGSQLALFEHGVVENAGGHMFVALALPILPPGVYMYTTNVMTLEVSAFTFVPHMFGVAMVLQLEVPECMFVCCPRHTRHRMLKHNPTVDGGRPWFVTNATNHGIRFISFLPHMLGAVIHGLKASGAHTPVRVLPQAHASQHAENTAYMWMVVAHGR